MKNSIKKLNEREMVLVSGAGFGDEDENFLNNRYLLCGLAAFWSMYCGCMI